MGRLTRSSFVRDALVATVLLASLYGLARGVRFQPVQLPGYLLVVGFDTLEFAVGPAGPAYPALFAAYLAALGALGAAAVRAVRRRVPDGRRNGWRSGVAGALAATGALSLLFAVAIFVGTSQTEPVRITGVTGLVLLGLAGWFAGAFEVRINWR